jgi:hypothetical protein
MWLFQLHCKEDPINVFPEMNVCGLIPNVGIALQRQSVYIILFWE